MEKMINEMVDLYLELNARSLGGSFPRKLLYNQFLEKKESIQSLVNLLNCKKEDFDIDCVIVKEIYPIEDSQTHYHQDISIQLFKKTEYDNYKIMFYNSHLYLDKDKDFYFSFKDSTLEEVKETPEFYCENTNDNKDIHIIIYKYFEKNFEETIGKASNLAVVLKTLSFQAFSILEFIQNFTSYLEKEDIEEYFIGKDLLKFTEDDIFFIELKFNDFSIRDGIDKIKRSIYELNEFKRTNISNLNMITQKYEDLYAYKKPSKIQTNKI